MAVIFARTSSSITRWVRPSLFLPYSRTAHQDDTPATTKTPKPSAQFVALVNDDKNISFIKLEDALKIAERRRLRLLKVKDFDKKHQCPLYTLQSEADILGEDIKERRKKETGGGKGPKLLSISSRISQNDLLFKTRRVLTWVDKGHEVRVTIKGSDGGSKEDAYKQMEGILKDKCRILQTRSSGQDIKFQVIQLKPQPTSEV